MAPLTLSAILLSLRNKNVKHCKNYSNNDFGRNWTRSVGLRSEVSMQDRRVRGFGKRLVKRLSKRMWLPLGLLFSLLPAMAVMQYVWIGQVSDAARERAKARLENSVEQLISEFDAEITRARMAFWALPVEEAADAPKRFADRFREWNRVAPYPQLIRDAYL